MRRPFFCDWKGIETVYERGQGVGERHHIHFEA